MCNKEDLATITTQLKMGIYKAKKTFTTLSMEDIMSEESIFVVNNVSFKDIGKGKLSITLYISHIGNKGGTRSYFVCVKYKDIRSMLSNYKKTKHNIT